MGSNLQFLVTLLKIIAFLPFVIVLIYISIKYGGEKLQDMQKGKYMKILDRLSLSKDNSLLIVKIGDKAYLMSSTNGNVQIVSELSSEDIRKIESSKDIVEYESLKEFYKKLRNKKEDKYEK
ncbi:flagellar biosynthetic protein FliO [Clostridium lundense]|uniref:flagellar biosynthetic protein FliO n=1 Tax=Clostridium lundense TaxID=319475 RepID=UPI00047FEB1E|nr:flagellar biosynthetic protein FliO [Clostridium lundense]